MMSELADIQSLKALKLAKQNATNLSQKADKDYVNSQILTVNTGGTIDLSYKADKTYVDGQFADFAQNIKNQGAKTDGTNTAIAITNSITAGHEVIIPTGTYTNTNELAITSSVHLEGKKGNQINQTNSTANSDMSVSSDDVTIDNINLNGSSINQSVFVGSVKRFKVKKSTLVSAKTGIHINSANIQDVDIVHNDINASGYGILSNANAKNGKNLNILFNKIYSANKDALELNNPSTSTTDTWKQAKIIGNTLTSDTLGTDSNSGFAIGIAKTRDVVVIGNITEKSRLEALHIEDDQENVVVSGNVFNGCVADGARIHFGGASSTGQAKPVIITNNHFAQDQNTKTGTGIYRIFDGSGSLEVVINNNIVRGFDKGLWVDGPAFASLDGSIMYDCNTAVKLGLNVAINGKVYAINTPTLLELTNGSIMDRVVSKTTITNLFNYVGVSGAIGATIKGFTFPTSDVAFSTGYTDIPLFPIPNMMNGKVQISSSKSGSGSYFSAVADLTYDGTNLTTVDLVKIQYGAFYSSPSFSVINGYLNIRVYSGSVLNQPLLIDFSGIYYVQS